MEKLIPKLRFPEFKGEWEKKKVGDISTKINSGKTPLGGQEVYVESGILFIRSQNVTQDKLSFENSTYITEEVNNTMKNSVVLPNDILLNITGASLGRSCVVSSNFSIGNVNQHVCIIRLNNENNPYFLQPIFSSEKGQTFFQSLQTGSGREGLNFQSIKGITLTFPTLSEQQKIATFLTSVDEKLQALKKKKSLLEQYKKGVMQKIFSQELRFKDENGNNFPDWEEKSLGEISDKIMYGMNAAAIKFDGHNKYLRITDIDDKTKKYLPNPITSPDGKIEEKYKLNFGDIVFTRTGASVGKSYVYNINDGNLFFAGFLIKFSIINANSYFIFSQTLLESYNKWVQLMSMRSGQPGINAEEYKTYIIQYPCIEEQTHIANFLRSIDDKINHCCAQIAKMEVWKKGLLQGMFC
jgi:type I restriction enzyme S subunit